MDSQAKHAMVAAGRADLLIRLPAAEDYREKIWDQAAGAILIEEAGGRVTDMHGEPLDFGCGRTLARNAGIIASNGHLHEAVIEALRPRGGDVVTSGHIAPRGDSRRDLAVDGPSRSAQGLHCRLGTGKSTLALACGGPNDYGRPNVGYRVSRGSVQSRWRAGRADRDARVDRVPGRHARVETEAGRALRLPRFFVGRTP